jgi:DUF1680 family protein
MSVSSPTTIAAAVLPGPDAAVRLRPLDGHKVRLRGGFWGERVARNRAETLRHGYGQLRTAGNFANFEAVRDGGAYSGLRGDSGHVYPFLDSDVYKWLEAVGWELGREPDFQLAALADRAIELVASAQRPDGYLNTYVELTAPDRPFHDLQWGHELYSAGHLFQAAVAWQRALGDGRLLAISERLAGRIDDELGPRGRDGVDGHPEIEMALVELYRLTGERRWLDLAVHQLELRGHGLLGEDRFGAVYWQDHAPVRSAPTVTGHAVRQLYLDCGAVDVAVETGDAGLLAAVVRRFDDMLATRTYLTGALGARHRDEAFGDPYELPPDRAYAETCAAIASCMLSFRLLLATGEARFADHYERTLYNGVLPGVSLDGRRFFYVNPLQRRHAHTGDGPRGGGEGRESWYACACCPPNLMRVLSSLEQQLATMDHEGIQLQHPASGTFEAGAVRLEVETGYPADGRIRVTVAATPADPWTLSVRVAPWSGRADAEDGYVRFHRSWAPGERVEVELDVTPRITIPDRRIDAVRGSAAVERGPLVYCVEQVDLPDGVEIEQLELRTDEAIGGPVAAPGLGPEVPALELPVAVRASAPPAWPYGAPDGGGTDAQARITAVPYYAWANRVVGAMRVFIPLHHER